jgi:hypothetical protein
MAAMSVRILSLFVDGKRDMSVFETAGVRRRAILFQFDERLTRACGSRLPGTSGGWVSCEHSRTRLSAGNKSQRFDGIASRRGRFSVRAPRPRVCLKSRFDERLRTADEDCRQGTEQA